MPITPLVPFDPPANPRSIAGSDTTAGTISLTFFHLLTNPGTYQKLQDEIDAISTHGANVILPDNVARNLPYLQACIREALRIQAPVASGPFHKAVPVGGDTLCGKHLPHGTRVSTNGAMYAIGRAKTYWGADAKVFRPERWLEADPATKQRMVDILDLTWSGGAFVCPGKAIAVMQAGKAVAEVCLFLSVLKGTTMLLRLWYRLSAVSIFLLSTPMTRRISARPCPG